MAMDPHSPQNEPFCTGNRTLEILGVICIIVIALLCIKCGTGS
jgi:hypothetical protein